MKKSHNIPLGTFFDVEKKNDLKVMAKAWPKGPVPPPENLLARGRLHNGMLTGEMCLPLIYSDYGAIGLP